jgi:CheY-like chemotaxis protein
MPFRVLIADPVPESREAIERTLTGLGHFVTSVSNFQEAKQRVLLATPDLLVTALKLGAYNGIQLVLRAHADHPGMGAIVMHDTNDPVLEREATNAGASYLITPIDEPAFVVLVDRLLNSVIAQASSTVARKWPRKHAGVDAAVSGDTAKVVDVSYGGMRLELSGVPDEALMTIETVAIPNVGTVTVHPVWARMAAGGSPRWWCGAEVDARDELAAGAWRRFVDSLS